jgi:hypothetical protein
MPVINGVTALLHAAPDGMIMSVEVATSPFSPAFGAGVPSLSTRAVPRSVFYCDVSLYGQRFRFGNVAVHAAAGQKGAKDSPPASALYKVVLNWTAALNK